MPDRWRRLSVSTLRWIVIIAPPLALVLLWLSRRIPRRQKVYGTLAIPVFGLIHLSVLLAALHLWWGIDLYEWRGGYRPTLTLRPTRPDFDAVELQRRQQRPSLSAPNHSAGKVYWTGFRGPNRDGVYAEQPIRTNWAASPPKLLWRQPIGGGYASFAVANGVAYTIEQRREKEVVTAYALDTGRELWTHGWEGSFQESFGGDGPRATPTWHDGRIYAQGATGELQCLDGATGASIWRRNILSENFGPDLEYGCAISPLVLNDLVITLPGGPRGKSVAAYERTAGSPRWSSGDDRAAYVSPTLVKLAGEPQLLIVGAKQTRGLRVSDGKVLWEFAWGEPRMGRNVAQPVVWNGDKIMLSAGYDVGCVAIQVRRHADAFEVSELWRSKLLKNKFSSSIFWQGNIYGLDEDILTCLDSATGERRWKDGRFGYGQIILANGHLIILCGNGDLALVKAQPDKFELVARVPGIQGKTWNHPALAQGKLLVRNLAEMACFDLAADPPVAGSH